MSLPIDYLEACQPGRLFFWEGTGPMSAINRFYQRRQLRKRGRFKEAHFGHVGIIGDRRGAYESSFTGARRGPSRDQSIDMYLKRKGTLVICEPIWNDDEFTPREKDRGLLNLITFIQQRAQSRFAYDWLSLATVGRVQMNNSAICSEMAGVYISASIALRDAWTGNPDIGLMQLRDFMLPDDIFHDYSLEVYRAACPVVAEAVK